MKTEFLKTVFTEYLKSTNSPYAILINGSWGSGKTHFWKSKLAPIAEKEGYKTLYISLNGLNKIEALKHQLFIRLIPILSKQDNKVIKGATTLFTNVVNLASKAYLKGSLDELFKGVGLDNFDFSKSLICFDDFERSKIDVKEVLGFINNYIEHKSLKAIILSDENRVSGQADYDSIKEKVIGRIWSFELNIVETLPSLFETFKTPDNSFYNFLRVNNPLITEIILEYEFKNLRIISFYFSLLEGLFLTLKDAKQEYVSEVILMTALIANEFKKGKLKSSDSIDFKNLDNLEQFIFSMKVQESLNKKNDKSNHSPTYTEEFHNLYFGSGKRKFVFYPAVYAYVLTGYLDHSLFKNELAERDPKPLPEKVKEFKLLITARFRELSNEDFAGLTVSVLRNARAGEYSIYEYSTVALFYYYFLDNKLIDIPKSEIDEAIHEGLSIAKKRTEPNEGTLLSLLHFPEANPEVVKIIDEIKGIHYELRGNRLTKTALNFIETLNTKDEISISEAFEKNRLSKDLFQYIDRIKLLKAIIDSSNRKLFYFTQSMEERYKISNIGEFLFEDYNTLMELQRETSKHISTASLGQPRKFLMETLQKTLSDICDHLVSTKGHH